jgi:hypothetical protein
MSLQEYLSNLNSAESQWGVWVNPDNIDDYRVGQFCYENGGISDNKICIGSLDKLSFGFQSQHDAIKEFLTQTEEIQYNGRKIKVDTEGVLRAFSDGNLDEKFRSFLEEKAQIFEQTWAEYEAEDFVMNKIPEIIEQALKDAEEESPYAYQWEEWEEND